MPNIQTTSPTPPAEGQKRTPKTTGGTKPPEEVNGQMEELEQEVRYR